MPLPQRSVSRPAIVAPTMPENPQIDCKIAMPTPSLPVARSKMTLM
jgi:hypothetical protein